MTSRPIEELSKSFANLQAQFALKGHVLSASQNADGRLLYSVTRWGQSRTFTHEHDIVAFLRQIAGGAA